MKSGPYGFNMTQTCLTCLDRQEGYFCNLDDKTLEIFDRLTFSTSYPANAVIFSEGEAPRGIFMLCHGNAKVSVTSSEGKTLVTRMAEEGELLGLSSVMSGQTHRATVETVEPCQMKFVRTDDFMKFVREHGDALFRTSRQLSHECHAMTDQLRSVGLAQTAQQKLIKLLVTWAEERGRREGKEVKVKVALTHAEIAELIGTSRETVTRTLAELKRREIITVKGSTMIIHDGDALVATV